MASDIRGLLVGLSVLCGSLVGGCGDGSGPEVGVLGQEVRNGIISFNESEIDVCLAANGAKCDPALPAQTVCSGTLIRNNVVLTDAHCFAATQSPCYDGCSLPLGNGDYLPENMGVTSTETGDHVLGLAGGVSLHPSADAAIMVLSTSMAVNGSTLGHSTMLWGLDDYTAFETNNVVQYGYGREDCANAQSTERNWQSKTEGDYAPDTRYLELLPDAWGRSDDHGDSGASYRWTGNLGTYVWGPTQNYLTALVGWGDVDASNCPTNSRILKASAFRDWVHDELNDIDYSFYDEFDSDLGIYEYHEPNFSQSGPMNWSISGGALRESSNIHSMATGYPGTIAVETTAPISDGWVYTTSMSSSDNDAMGLVGRYRDVCNYYYFTVDEQRKFARLWKYEDCVATLLGNEPTPSGFDWSSGAHAMHLRMEGDNLVGYLDYQFIVDGTDQSFTAGLGGAYIWAMGGNGAAFGHLRVQPL